MLLALQRAKCRDMKTVNATLAVVLRLMAGTNTRGLTPWFIDIRPSITFETPVFAIWHYLLLLSLWGKRKSKGMTA